MTHDKKLQGPPEPASVPVTLVLCPSFSVDEPHIGLATLATGLEAQGFPTAVEDLNIAFYLAGNNKRQSLWGNDSMGAWVSPQTRAELIANFLQIVEDDIARLATCDSDLLGFSVYRSNYFFAQALIKKIRECSPTKAIVLGGPGLTIPAVRQVFADGLVDCLVHGEADESLVEIIRQHALNRSLSGVSGTSWWNGREFESQGSRKPPSLKELPFPTYQQFPLEHYNYTESLPLLLARGCPNRCRFCIDRPYFERLRFRPVRSVTDEIRHHVTTTERSVFNCSDLLVNPSVDHLETLCGALKNLREKENLDFSLNGQVVVRPFMRRCVFELMREAGFHAVNFGVESFADKVLGELGKPFSASQAERCIQDAAEAGLEVRINIIVGAPSESESEFQETLQAVERLAPWVREIGSASPLEVLPGSELFSRKKEFGIVEDTPTDRDWGEIQAAFGIFPWKTEDGQNNQTLRSERLRRFFDHCQTLGLSIYQGSRSNET